MKSFSKKIDKMINLAFFIREESKHKIKMGCVIFNKGIISKSCNSDKTCPHLDGFVDKLHAEARAIKYANSSVQNAWIVIVRGSRKKPLLAKPCPHCLKLIKEAGIKRVIYSTYEGFETMDIRYLEGVI